MIFILGAVVQVIISLIAILLGYCTFTNLGFSNSNPLEKVVGLLLVAAGGYGLYDLASMFTFTG